MPEKIRLSEPLPPKLAQKPEVHKFTARGAELAELDNWLKDPNHPIMVMDAVGGMGKTTLASYWVDRIKHKLGDYGLLGLMWASLYEQTTLTRFFDEAIAYVSDGKIDPNDYKGLGAKTECLLSLLRNNPVLLVLDGFERQLVAYRRLDAPYRGDVDDLEYDRCIEPTLSRFIAALSNPEYRTKLLITTRIYPEELEPAEGETVRRMKLQGFNLSEAVEYFRSQKISVTEAEIRKLLGKFFAPEWLRDESARIFHPLMLSAIAGMVKERRSFESVLKMPVEEAIRRLRPKDPGRTHHVLEIAYKMMSEPVRELAARLSAFRFSFDFDSAKVVALEESEHLKPLFKNEWELEDALVELKDRNILEVSGYESERRYDFHPIIRNFFYKKLSNPKSVHEILVEVFKRKADEVFEKLPEELREFSKISPQFASLVWQIWSSGELSEMNDEQIVEMVKKMVSAFLPESDVRIMKFLRDATARSLTSFLIKLRDTPFPIQSLTDLNPVIELYHHLVGAGRHQEAIDLFYDRLAEPLYYRFGAYRLRIQLLSGLFDGGEVFDEDGDIGRLLLERDDYKGIVLNALANSYSLSGEPEKAVRLFEAANAIAEEHGNKKNLAIGLGNLADDLLKLGRIREAEAKLRESAEICREIEDEFDEPIAHQELGRLLGTIGKTDEAMRELEESTGYFEKEGHKQGICIDEAYRALVSLMNAQVEDALGHAGRARKLADVEKLERDIIWAEWLLGLSNLALNKLDEARGHLNKALKRCRRISMVYYEPDILLGLARLTLASVKKGVSETFDKAKNLAEEALKIAENSKYRLKLADIHNFLAELELVRLGLLEPQLTHWNEATSKRKSKSRSLNRTDLEAAIGHLRKAAEFGIDRDIWEEKLSESEREAIRNCEIPCDELSKRLTYIYLGACRRTQSLMKICRS